MTNEKLNKILKKVELNKNEEVCDGIYHCFRIIKNKVFDGDGKYHYSKREYEFLVITEDKIKKAIILRIGDIDLHWLVLPKYRQKHVLSNALRKGIISKLWPSIKSVTCCFDLYDEYDEKLSITNHLAEISKLFVK